MKNEKIESNNATSDFIEFRERMIIWFVKDIDNYVFNLKDVKIQCITKNDKRIDTQAKLLTKLTGETFPKVERLDCELLGLK